MRNLNRLTNAASKEEAIRDYRRLMVVAAEYGLLSYLPEIHGRAGHRKIDGIARVAVERMLNGRPYLREKLAAIYPGFVMQ